MNKEELKPQDLRIGNYVEVDNYKIIQLENIHPKGTTKGNEQYLLCMLKPIPLTEEFLLKMGFNRDNTACLSLRLSENTYLFAKIENENCTVNLCVEGIDADDRCDEFDVILNVFHVHKLQNLFFALTGEELTLTETPCEKKE